MLQLDPGLGHSLDPWMGSDIAGGYTQSVPRDLHPDGLEATGDILRTDKLILGAQARRQSPAKAARGDA
jgi:hypothetical protein